jgi:beta-glucanase (GH16 family)
VTYGRIETRLSVPRGAGLWPAVWALGATIDSEPWPACGEIDVMEHVGREPRRVFGTLHGPGYSGDRGYGRTTDLDRDVADDFHVFAVDWRPGHIAWTLDDTVYMNAEPRDLAPHEWVFDRPFFLLLNLAVGGHFGGPLGPNTTFPQQFVVDYVRAYEQDGLGGVTS